MDPADAIAVVGQMKRLLNGDPLIVVCGRHDDAIAWERLLGSDQCKAIGLDKRALHAAARQTDSGRLAFHHNAISGLGNGSGWLADLANSFDPHKRAALIVPDPLDPPHVGDRRRYGRRLPVWRLCEDKAVVDAIWAQLGLASPRYIVAHGDQDLATLSKLVDDGDGVVCSVQNLGAAPTSGAEGLWWWRDGMPPAIVTDRTQRLKVMQLVPGTPIRLHGIVFAHTVITFPPMEIVTLPRLQSGTFLCCGAVGTAPNSQTLRDLNERIGLGLSTTLGYKGAYCVDGIMSANGFQPTDLNSRLTSATESAPATLRVLLQMANVLAREGHNLDDTDWLGRLIEQAFPEDTVTIYGASSRGTKVDGISVRWTGSELAAADQDNSHGRICLAPSLRGWTLTAHLQRSWLPTTPYAGPCAPMILTYADKFMGTDFGALAPPFGH